MGVGVQRYVPAALPPGKSQYPLYGRLGGSQSRSGQVRKISLLPRLSYPSPRLNNNNNNNNNNNGGLICSLKSGNKLFKLQIRPPSLILLLTTSQDR